jgi:Protein of unknown function (DUF3124)
MRWQIGWQGLLFAIAVFLGGLLLGSRLQTSDPIHSSAAERLQPAAAVSTALTPGATVYVPVYSSLYLGLNVKQQMVELAATVSVRNVSQAHPIVIEWVRYYDSKGKLVRDYIDKPAALPPLGSVEFVIQRSDVAGGPGANFLIRWQGPQAVDEPVIEAVMLGQSGNAGISFTSVGRVVKSESGAQ